MNSLTIRTMRTDEIPLVLNWAAAEGWNPGLADDACFATVDPKGFLIGELDGVPAATISCVNYDENFAFLGFYIVRQDLRGCGNAQYGQQKQKHSGQCGSRGNQLSDRCRAGMLPQDGHAPKPELQVLQEERPKRRPRGVPRHN